MMVPMLKLHPSSVKVLVVSMINGARVDLIYLLFLMYFCFIPMGSSCKTYLDVKLRRPHLECYFLSSSRL
jgi:hypothetical protein